MNSSRSRPSGSILTGADAPSNPVARTDCSSLWIERQCGLAGRNTCWPALVTSPALATPPESCHSVTELAVRSRRRPVDHRRADRCAQRIALAVSEAEAADEQAEPRGLGDDLRRNGVQAELRAPEQRERAALVDRSPGQVDEAVARRTLDVTALDVRGVGRSGDIAVDGPLRRGRARWRQTEKLGALTAPLDRDVDAVIA